MKQPTVVEWPCMLWPRLHQNSLMWTETYKKCPQSCQPVESSDNCHLIGLRHYVAGHKETLQRPARLKGCTTEGRSSLAYCLYLSHRSCRMASNVRVNTVSTRESKQQIEAALLQTCCGVTVTLHAILMSTNSRSTDWVLCVKTWPASSITQHFYFMKQQFNGSMTWRKISVKHSMAL